MNLNNLNDLTDEQLYGLCRKFAKKLAGLSEEQVRRVLNLEEKFRPMPILRSMLINGEVSINKLARVAFMVTPGNEQVWAEQVKLLSNRALETLVKDEKIALQNQTEPAPGEAALLEKSNDENKEQNGLFEGFFEDKSVHVHTNPSLSGDSVKPDENDLKLLGKFSTQLKRKLHELLEKGFDINSILLELLQKREVEIVQQKEQIAAQQKSATSRYIPAAIRKIIQKEQGHKCSINTCSKPAAVIHHTQRFALASNHNPHYLAQLCKEHHLIAHSIDVKFHHARKVAAAKSDSAEPGN